MTNQLSQIRFMVALNAVSTMFRYGAKFSVLLLALTAAVGQDVKTADERGSLMIRGRVIEGSGAVIVGVQVLAKNPQITLPRLTLTDDVGNYSLAGLSAGRYVVSVEAPDFVILSKELDLSPGSPNTLDFRLTQMTGSWPGPSFIDTRTLTEAESAAAAATAEAKARKARAERLVAEMWGLSMQGMGPGGNVTASELRRRYITQQLDGLGQDGVSALVLALKDPDVQMRRNADLVLMDLAAGYSSDIREALPALIQALEDPDASVRAWSAQTIGEIGTDAGTAVPALITLLKNQDEGSRNSSGIALGRIGAAAKAALPALREALRDTSIDVRRVAEQAIQNIQK